MRNFVKCFLEIEKDGVCLYSIIDIVCKIVYELDKLFSVERCFLNQCCASWRMLCESRCCMILLVIMCSSILQVMDVNDIGR